MSSPSTSSEPGVPPVVSTPPVTPAAPIGPSIDEYEKLIGGDTHNPHGILGAHPQPDGSTVIRTLRHHAKSVTLLTEGTETPLEHVHGGVFAVTVPGPPTDYRLRVVYAGPDGDISYEVDDPYRWLPTLGDIDLHLIGEGRHEFLWTVLGAHVRSYDTPIGSVTGTSFAVWAPSARGVRVTGDFDHWSGAGQPMRSLGSSGVWEVFLPDVGAGTRYKFQILGQDGVWREKADPMAFGAEIPPATASVVTTSSYTWTDDAWMEQRRAADHLAGPMSIYEIHAGSWRTDIGYREMADALVADLAETGFTHLEFLPLAGHPFGGSWGYQVTSYYAPDPRFGSPDDFRYLVDRLHQAGIGVILDWVPAHFPKDEWALGRFDGTSLYEHADPRRGEQPDWGTFVFDFGRREVRNFLVANALYWLEEFHLDGLRVDAVASMLYLDYSRNAGEWLPNVYGGRENLDAVAFIQETNATVGKRVPGAMMIAEESTAWPGVTRPTYLGGLGFHLKWNMGWMHDTLGYIARDPIYRAWHHNELTFSMMYAYTEQFVLPISHDEVVHGKSSLWGKIPGDEWQKAATLRAYYAYMWAHPGKQLLFMGQELGTPWEWSETVQVPWQLKDYPIHNGIRSLVGDLNRTYKATPALYTQDFKPEGFRWIDANDRDGNVLAFLRWGSDGSSLVCVVNFSPQPHAGYRVGLPFSGVWREAVNTDSAIYGGSGAGNMGAVVASDQPWHGLPSSATLTVPPLGALWLVPESAPHG
ncbi:1,4-alpha-glucan branching enzyme [Nakamurella panacisegetis]|uniref:1,4-alpha-glucan branching enzyme GlgB n=1 Tax=Nakamurella panacisegetis TaxID=1090615 RepID=A0A1H0RMY0_9ACTN|nr:1,4-alpha-glucan branching protein GlgB [Nakamurella panacisegetis]SDP30719.1 1,4-alpha-glucan branching enzyme [Nakamurella panacisegetis]